MLKETKIYETWEAIHAYRISLSLHEVNQIIHALEHDMDYPQTMGLYKRLDNRLRRLRAKIIDQHKITF